MPRTKGAVSCCEVTLADLNAALKPTATVLVSRVFCELNKIPYTPMRSTHANIEAAGNKPEVREEGVEITES